MHSLISVTCVVSGLLCLVGVKSGYVFYFCFFSHNFVFIKNNILTSLNLKLKNIILY
jgi:hypothetical protein